MNTITLEDAAVLDDTSVRTHSRRGFLGLIGLAGLAGAGAAVAGPAPIASANYAGQNIRRSASTASYNDGSITIYPLGYNRRSESSLSLIRGASYRMSKYPENAALLDVKFTGKRYREWDPSKDAYGAWHSMPKGYYIGPVYSNHDVTFQVDK